MLRAGAVENAQKRGSSAIMKALKVLAPWGVTGKDLEDLLARVTTRRKTGV